MRSERPALSKHKLSTSSSPGRVEWAGSAIDQAARWDKELSFDEQQLLVFIRMLLHKPHCVVIDKALDTLDDGVRKSIMNLFSQKLKDAAVINIGRTQRDSHFFKRVLHLVKEPSGRCFIPDVSTHSSGRVAEAMSNSTGEDSAMKWHNRIAPGL